MPRHNEDTPMKPNDLEGSIVRTEMREQYAALRAELEAKIEDVQKAADMLDDWRNRARRENERAMRWEEIANGLARDIYGSIPLAADLVQKYPCGWLVFADTDKTEYMILPRKEDAVRAAESQAEQHELESWPIYPLWAGNPLINPDDQPPSTQPE